jgi:hypothetical protein
MMHYDDIIRTVSEIVDNDNIYKEGMVLEYKLDHKRHKDMDEHLFYKSNPNGGNFQYSDKIEVEIGGILVRFIKEDLE